MPTWKKVLIEGDDIPASDITAGSFPSGNYDFPSAIAADTVNEHTAATGVTVDSVVLKDGEVNMQSGKAASISRSWMGV